MSKRKFWGWGYDDYEVDPNTVVQFKEMMKMAFGMKEFRKITPPSLNDIQLRSPRFNLPDRFQGYCTTDKFDRASHTYGKSYRDVWRGMHGHFNNPPDYIAYPTTEDHIIDLMAYATAEGIDLIPFGGGSSVCGGVEPDAQSKGVITIDMRHFDQVISIDKKGRTARIQAGVYGPHLEAQLKPHGYTMRHYPQSFEFSTLGGWIATRSGGHFATLFTHIDEFVQAVRVITPDGIMDTRGLPGSGAGPSEERLICGSEGTLGIITEATVRLQDIPVHKETVTVNFAKWSDGVSASRALGLSGLHPSNARLISKMEAFINGLGNGQDAVLILGFESHDHSIRTKMDRALVICDHHNGRYERKEKAAKSTASSEQWKKNFLQAPYLRDEIMQYGMIVETFETAVTWERFEAFHNAIESAANKAIKEICGVGFITCRFTHLYPDGPAPYYSIFAKGEHGREMEQWDQIKVIVSQALIDHGGTITHHHAVGKDHQPYYRQQMSEPFHKMLSAAKNAVDPKWIMNPGTLLER